jgi:hypothetical protein
MPEGKPVGVKCIHLDGNSRCSLFGDPSRPQVCNDFLPEPEFCGSNREEALKILYSLSDPPVNNPK